MARLPHLPIGITKEKFDIEQLRTFLETANNELGEFFGLVVDAQSRVAKTIRRHHKRFSRSFSLDLLYPAAGRSDDRHLFATVYCRAPKYAKVLELVLDLRVKSAVTRGASLFRTVPPYHTEFDSSDLWISGDLMGAAAKWINSNEPNLLDLLVACLYEGTRYAVESIKEAVLYTITQNLGKENAHSLFYDVLRYRRKARAQEEITERLSEENIVRGMRIEHLEKAIGDSIEEIAETKSITRSLTIAGIRERLEAALGEDSAQEAKEETAQEAQEMPEAVQSPS